MNQALKERVRTAQQRENRDPISGRSGAHAMGTGLGATAGGLAGNEIAETIDLVSEYAFWRDNFTVRHYVSKGASFEDYGPAYEYGVLSYIKYPEQEFDDVISELSRDWDRVRGDSALTWERARHAIRDAWNHVSR